LTCAGKDLEEQLAREEEKRKRDAEELKRKMEEERRETGGEASFEPKLFDKKILPYSLLRSLKCSSG